jgi:hypothetical protein
MHMPQEHHLWSLIVSTDIFMAKILRYWKVCDVHEMHFLGDLTSATQYFVLGVLKGVRYLQYV